MSEEMTEEEAREMFADLEHQRWGSWHKYARNNWESERIARWDKLSDTPYSELSEELKQKDREEVDRYWKFYIRAKAQDKQALDLSNSNAAEVMRNLKSEREKVGIAVEALEKYTSRPFINFIAETALSKIKEVK